VTRFLVTGAGGMLGRDLLAVDVKIVGLTHDDLDVTDLGACRAAVDGVRPDVVINCAAWTDVDGAESDEAAALAVNRDGAANLAVAARGAGARLIHLSTDYVFAGAATRPYVESDATGPISAYGRTKLAGERAVLAASSDHAVVRTAWLFGVHGRSFASTMLGLAQSGRHEVAVVADQVGCPTFTGHLARKLLALAAQGRGGIFHEAGAGRCSWFEFAQAIFARAGLDVVVTPTTTADFPRPAPRPAWSVLASERDPDPMPSWQEGLAEYLRAREADLRAREEAA